MFDQTLFDQHLSLLAATQPLLAEKISQNPASSSQWVPCETHQENNLRYSISDKTVYLHDPSGAYAEAQRTLDSFQLADKTVLYIYGIGLGYFYQALLPWLKEDEGRYLVFLEDDLTVIRYLLQTPQAAALLKDPQVDLQLMDQEAIQQGAFQTLTKDYILRPFQFISLPAYQQLKASYGTWLKDLIAFESTEHNIHFLELSRSGYPFFNNFYPNLFQLPLAYEGSELFGQFQGVPAIICGAGPSLVKQIPLLKTLSSRALLFAPGSALNILTYQGVWPHFGVLIDPNPESFHRQIMHRGFETPIFYRNRLHHEALTSMHGPRLFLAEMNFYQGAKWFEEQLEIESLPVEEGYNVVHATLQIARLLGCNPIILVGLDLSISEEKHYAPGVERHPLFPYKKTEDFLNFPIRMQDIHGKPVTSYWHWVAQAQWTELYHFTHPTLEIINATDAGIGLFSIPNLPLSQVIEKYLTKEYDVDHQVQKALQHISHVSLASAEIEKVMKQFYAHLKSCESLCLKLVDHFNAQHLPNPSLSAPLLLEEQILEKKFQEEIGYQVFLKQFDAFFLTFTQKDQSNFARFATPSQHTTTKEIQWKEERYRFLLQTTRFHLNLLTQTLNHIPPMDPTLAQEDFTSLMTSSKKEGEHKVYYTTGKIKSELHYDQNQLTGPVRLYYPNGKLKREIYFVEGQREGKERSWYENGQLFTEIEYHHNQAKQARCWLSNGTLAKEIIL